jgi:NMD protein affecting ribosome stability and mRNA decay
MSSRCLRCGKTSGHNFCVRCKRAVCDACWNGAWALCQDCGAYKEGVRWDFTQTLTHAANTAAFATEKLRTDCALCPVLRDQLLYLLKTAKSVEYAAQQEGLRDEAQRATQLRQRLTDLAVKVLIRLEMRADGDIWRHL